MKDSAIKLSVLKLLKTIHTMKIMQNKIELVRIADVYTEATSISM